MTYLMNKLQQPLKAGVDLDFLPPGKIGRVKCISLAVLLIRNGSELVNHSDKIKNSVQLQNFIS